MSDMIAKTFLRSSAWDGNGYTSEARIPTLSPPTNLATSIAGSTVTVTWTNANASYPIVIERSSTSSSGGYTIIATKAAGSTSHTDTLTSSGTYYYRAKHVVNGTSSAYSGVDSETLAEVPPLSDGDSVTVTISGAGSNVSAANQAFLGGASGAVEGGTVGQRFSTNMPSGWAQSGSFTGPVFSNTRSLNGTKALLNDRTGGAYQFGMRYDTGAARRTLLARFSYYMTNPNATVGQLKLWRSVGEIGTAAGIGDGDTEDAYITFNQYNRWNVNSGPLNAAAGSGLVAWTIPRSSAPRASSWASGSFSNGAELWHFEEQWVTIEVCLTASTGAEVADGRVQVAAYLESTGELISNNWAENVILSATADRPQARYHVLQGYMGNGFDTACKLWIDRDVYCTYSDTTTIPKFIILGNASTFSACTVRTVCEFTSWVDNGATSDITIRVNKGRHSSLSGLYVYAMSQPGVPINSAGVALS